MFQLLIAEVSPHGGLTLMTVMVGSLCTHRRLTHPMLTGNPTEGVRERQMENREREGGWRTSTVSYTHLTLPTTTRV